MFLPITDQYGSTDDLQHVHQSTLTETKPETGRSLRLCVTGSLISVQLKLLIHWHTTDCLNHSFDLSEAFVI